MRQQRGIAYLPIVIALIIVAAVGGWWYYHHLQTAKQAAASQFITANVYRGDIQYTINASGSLRPIKTVEVGAQVSGEISKLNVEIGDVVKKGAAIAEIDARTKENAKKNYVAQLSSYQAELATDKAELTKNQLAYHRARTLYQRGAGSKEDLETAQAALDSAKNQVTQTQANITQSELDISNADVDLGYTKVTAPIAGTVIAVPVEQGQTVNATQSTPTIAIIADTSVMTVKTEIAEADVAEVKAGLPVSFTLLGKDSNIYHGTLKSIDPAPKEISDDDTFSSDDAVYYYGDIDVKNPNGLLRYGMTATVTINVSEAKNVLIVPMTALNDGADGQSTVQVMDKNGKVHSQKVSVGLEDGVHAEIKSGLKEGEKVIVSNASAATTQTMRGPQGPF